MQHNIITNLYIISKSHGKKRFYMKVIKRDGHVVDFCPDKIEAAIEKANASVTEEKRVSPIQIRNIIKYIEIMDKKRILVEDIQDII